MKRAGEHGIITIETSDQNETTLEVFEGLRFDRGYLSEYFVTNPATLECVLENCVILLYQRRIQSMKDLLPLLEQVARANRTLLIIAEDVEGEALSTLTLNKIKGTLRCAAVKAPGEGDRRKALMEDIAILTGGRFFNDELGVPLGSVRLDGLGRAEKATLTRDDTTILGGAGSSEGIQERTRSIRTQIATTVNDYDREKLQKRLARLAGSVAVLKAGSISETELVLKRYRLESAMHSARSAVEHGRVVGGGIALLRAGIALEREKADSDLDTEIRQSVRSVLEEPVRQLIENAQKSPTQILIEILESDSPYRGFNATHREVEDLLDAGVLDPVKSAELSLRVALSYAGSVLQTGTWDLSTSAVPAQKPGQSRS
jgi:chaperonin GroEL